MNTCKTCQHWYCEYGMKEFNVGVCSHWIVCRKDTHTINMDINAGLAEKNRPTLFSIHLNDNGKGVLDFYTPADFGCTLWEGKE